MPTPTTPTRPTSPAVYRVIRHRQARGDYYEVEGFNATGARWIVATCDDRHEARETVRRLEAYEARQGAARALAAARAAAGTVNDRRLSAGRLPPAAVARLRALSPSLVADRLAIAQAIRAARSELRRFSA